MYWVKLTKVDGGSSIFVNLARYDVIYRHEDDYTVIRSTLSETEEDFTAIEVNEKPDSFIPLMESE